jgi:hypothetical protein
MTTENNEGGEKLYAGKFKTVEDLENGYKSSAVIFDENEKLKKQLTEVTTVPGDYINPADIALEENRVSELKARAKEAGMTQAQYEKFVRSDKARVDQHAQSFENAKKEVGEPTINMLKDYISKQYPTELGETMLKTFIANKTARDAALKHRDTLLNTATPGLGKISGGGYNVTDEDVQKAYREKEKNPHNLKAREHYLNLLRAKAS